MRRTAAGFAATLAVMIALGGCSVAVQGTATSDTGATATTPARTTTTSRTTSPPRTTEAPAVDPAGGVFDDARGRFALAPPPGWTVDTSGAQGTAVVFLDPRPTQSTQGRFTANINVLVVPAGADLPNTVVGARQELRGLTNYGATTDEPFTLDDGTPAHVLGGTFTDPGSGFELRNLQLFTVHEGSTVVVTGTALTQTWTDFEATFEASLRSLTVAT